MASASGRRDAIDLERGKTLSELLPELRPGPPKLPRSPARDPLERAGQFCLVCLDRAGHGQYAIAVPCLKPSRERQIQCHRITDTVSDDNIRRRRVPIYGPIEEWEKAVEDDRAVYARMVEMCFQDLGSWRWWLPFYGVVSVSEVTIKFDGRVGPNDRFFGLIEPVDLEKTKEKCHQAIENCPVAGEWNDWDECDPARKPHADECQTAMDYSGSECLTVAAEKAKERLKRMHLRYLLKQCARDPNSANGLKTLLGMAQESCIYPKM
ncbi:hypothetical protein B0T24DRAFT_516770 [Lasiosphaeria ovina]|uniref:Uncharacterized protein n=1 Tax=Lasiosphaeria ovina TaxID=92902 RepID=A0AAE0NIN4_9PEZI|nr:hypothetical protein B0T24DRAFT_516770 [Lasiosphaeria ovina]